VRPRSTTVQFTTPDVDPAPTSLEASGPNRRAAVKPNAPGRVATDRADGAAEDASRDAPDKADEDRIRQPSRLPAPAYACGPPSTVGKGCWHSHDVVAFLVLFRIQ
jgi:hypothetical protein